MERVTIEQADYIPMELLLLADPSEEQIRSYLKRGIVFSASVGGKPCGVYVLLETRPDTMEIMNVAVEPEHQN
jgi:hypothetical protein